MTPQSGEEAFEEILDWLRSERRRYQTQIAKFDYDQFGGQLRKARDGLTEDSHFYAKGIMNYVGKVRLYGVSGPARMAGIQAILKLAATMIGMVEHLYYGGDIEGLPEPGHPSQSPREIQVWDRRAWFEKPPDER